MNDDERPLSLRSRTFDSLGEEPFGLISSGSVEIDSFLGFRISSSEGKELRVTYARSRCTKSTAAAAAKSEEHWPALKAAPGSASFSCAGTEIASFELMLRTRAGRSAVPAALVLVLAAGIHCIEQSSTKARGVISSHIAEARLKARYVIIERPVVAWLHPARLP